MSSKVAIIGGSVGASQAALTLAEMGIEVELVTPYVALGCEDPSTTKASIPNEESLSVWPLLLRTASHPLITLHTDSEIKTIAGKKGKFTIKTTRYPRYVRNELCTSCGRCEDECSVKVISVIDGEKVSHSAIHAPIPGSKTVPSGFHIEKNGIAPCRAACPLGINVQGYVSLLSKGKTDEALSLINDVAPLAGILGRVCTHPCESNCTREEVDSPVFIQALHRFAADNAPSGIRYKLKPDARPRREKIAIVGSGPAGLTAAWELARRGYKPTIFESHAVVGGMLATGIPRFRLPREVREREIEAIKALGVDIKTGVTIGKDVYISDLRERGYRAFFIAIGAHENRPLNIPGEDLEGVVDAVSLLFALNLKVGASVGSNVVVIGGGNSAIDSARTVKKRSKGIVRILYRRTAEEMTAVKEETEDTVKEGISIEYLTQPIEILGDGYKVTGIRCQRMQLGEPDADGRRRPVPIPGSEFDIEADHVVIAIGQKPNGAPFQSTRLITNEEEATIKVNPLTLETNVPGIFAGGDCVTGPNNVVEAAADGLKAAESIDRYLRGRDLKRGRTLEKPQPVDVDVSERTHSHYKRSQMPVIPYYKRKGSFEETHLGLPADIAEREAGRCLNCALCSECMECDRVCELNAVFHDDRIEDIDIGVNIIIDFSSANGIKDDSSSDSTGDITWYLSKPGVYMVRNSHDYNQENELAKASAVALTVASELKTKDEIVPITMVSTSTTLESAGNGKERIGVFLCNCGGSTSSIVDFDQVINEVLNLPHVCTVHEISQACTDKGADRIASEASEWKLDRVVLAACRCCGLDQICFSCTENRVKCQQNIGRSIAGIPIEFVNIREQCAKVHRDDRGHATRNAIDSIWAGIIRASEYSLPLAEVRSLERSVLVIGTGLRSLSAAQDMINLGFSVAIISGPEADDNEQERPDYKDTRAKIEKQLEEKGVLINTWPDSLELAGSSGSYEVTMKYGSKARRIKAGALIIDMGGLHGEIPPNTSTIPTSSFLGRFIERSILHNPINGNANDLRTFTIRETAGIFVLPPDGMDPPDQQMLRGAAVAAKALSYLNQGTMAPRKAAVSIDRKLCRWCGNCAAICPYIELKTQKNGIAYAYVDQALCLGCGACIAHCPTGAMTQTIQSDSQIVSTLEALLADTALMMEE